MCPFSNKNTVKPELMTTCQQRPLFWGPNYAFYNLNGLQTTTTCLQPLLFLGPEGGRYTQVWLYHQQHGHHINNSNNQSPCFAADLRSCSFRDEFCSIISSLLSLLLCDCMTESNQCPSYGLWRRQLAGHIGNKFDQCNVGQYVHVQFNFTWEKWALSSQFPINEAF
jgi:hypothetical protein